jgi:hypothetical protein
MLNQRTWEACLIDCTKALGYIYGNRSQTCRMKGKTYRDAQPGELVNSVAVEHMQEHETIYGSEPVGEKHKECETTTER